MDGGIILFEAGAFAPAPLLPTCWLFEYPAQYEEEKSDQKLYQDVDQAFLDRVSFFFTFLIHFSSSFLFSTISL